MGAGLWRALEEVPGWCGVRAVWRERLGSDFGPASGLLRPLDSPALSVPWPGEPEGRRVVVHADDDIVAVSDETGESDPIAREDVVLWRLDAHALFASVARLLETAGTPAAVAGSPRLWWLGEFVPIEGVRFPVYLATSRMSEEVLRHAGHVAALTLRPFVLVTPSRRPASEELSRLIDSRGAAWITLDEALALGDDGGLRARRPVRDLLRPMTERHAGVPTPRGPRFATPPGSRWPHVQIAFRDGHTVSVRVGEATGVYGYADMGMASAKNNAPVKAWALLRVFAEEHGHLTWSSRKSSAAHRKQKQVLADHLRGFFGIDEDPFEVVDGGWRAKFRLVADR